MKKNHLLHILEIVCIITLLAACDDNTYDGPAPEEVTANYSNKLADGDRATLFLTYSGREMIGKSIYLKTENARKASLTLLNILPYENETTVGNVILTPAGGDKYAFSGQATSSKGTAFQYDGTVTKGKLCVNLTDIKIPSNPVSGTFALVKNAGDTTEKEETIDNKTHRYLFYHQTFYMNTDNEELGSLELLLANLLMGPLLNSVMNEVSFNTDGNITARYAPLPDTTNFLTDILLGGGIVRNENDWLTSPVNLATYYVAGNTDLYITPQIDMIIRQVESDRTVNTPSAKGLLDPITDAYEKLKEWATTGIRFNIKENPRKEYYIASESSRYIQHRKYEGDYILYIDKDEIKVFLPVIKMLIPLLMASETVQQTEQTTGIGIEQLVNSLIQAVADAKTLEIGLYLNKTR